MTVKRGDVVLVDYPFTTDQKRRRSSFHLPGDSATPRSGYSSRRGELFDEGLVVRCRHAEIEHIAETAGVVGQERPRIQPESGEDAGAAKTVRVRRIQHQASMVQDCASGCGSLLGPRAVDVLSSPSTPGVFSS